MLNNVFVYGTLKEGQWNDRPIYQQNRISCVKGVIQGRIYAVASFPGVKLNDDKSLIYGEVHTFPEEKMPEMLACMDRLEGYVEGREDNHYNRKIVTVTLENGKDVKAYVYEFARPIDEALRIESGEWTVDSRDQVLARNKKAMKAGR